MKNLKDGPTRKLAAAGSSPSVGDFLQRHRVAIVMTCGSAAGSELELDREHISMGRGPGVDHAFADEAMSREHACFDFADRGFKVRDLGSTNGVYVNESPVQAAELKHGDRIRLGEHTFQYVVEERRREPRTYIVEDGP